MSSTVRAELRSFIFLDQLQPQTMCYLGTWIKGSLPRSDMAAQIIEVAPGLDIEALTDVALKHTDVQAGILVVERQFGYLEIHSRSTEAVRSASAAVLEALDAQASDATAPTDPGLADRVAHRRPARVPDQPQQDRLDGARRASRCSCWRCSRRRTRSSRPTRPRRPPTIKVVDYRMIGATGRVYLTGDESDVRAAAEAAERSLGSAHDQSNGALAGLSPEELRAAVRAVLREVLPAGPSALASDAARRATWSIATDADLTAFVRRVAALCEDPERASRAAGRAARVPAGRRWPSGRGSQPHLDQRT